MALAGRDLLMNADLFRAQFPAWPGGAPRNPAFTDRDDRLDGEPAYAGGMSEREERLSSRDDD